MAFFEEITHEDVLFPIIFHTDTIRSSIIRDGAHWHRKLEILCTLEGSGFTLIDGERVAMSAGDIVVIPSGSIHVTRTEEEACRYHCLIIDQDFLSDHGLWEEGDLLPLCFQDLEGVGILQQINCEMTTRLPCYKELVMALVTQLVIGLRRRHLRDKHTSSFADKARHIGPIRKALAVIDREFAHSIALDYLCRVAGMSKYYFCRAFKQATGQTITQYINCVRCNQARYLLVSGQCNVGEAAQQCGFHNLSYFTKVYRRQYGRSPSQEKQTIESKKQ